MSEPLPQSALHPAQGSGAELLHELGWVLYVGATVIFVAVMILALLSVFTPARNIHARRWIIGGGLIFPAVTLTALLVYSVAVGNALSSVGSSRAFQLFLDCFGIDRPAANAASDVVRVHVVGKQWWWEVRYEVPGSSTPAVLANEPKHVA